MKIEQDDERRLKEFPKSGLLNVFANVGKVTMTTESRINTYTCA